MAFHLIEGLPAGGKSYYAVEVARQVWEEGGTVHTNLPLKMDAIEAKGWHERTVKLPDNPKAWLRKESQGKDEFGDEKFRYWSDIIKGGDEGAENIIIVDEAAMKWRSRSQVKEAEAMEPIVDLTRLQRHAGLDIYFIAQDRDHVPKVFRDMADTTTLCVNQANLPVVGPWLEKFSGKFRRIVKKGKAKSEFASYTARFDPAIGDLYETHGERAVLGLKTGGGRIKKTSLVNKRLWLKLGFSLLACVLMIGTGLWMTANQWDGMTGEEKETAQAPKLQTVREITPEGAVKTKQVQEAPTRPKGGLHLLEWELYDEHILGGVLRIGPHPEVRTRGGRKLRIGGSYEGQVITTQFQNAGWWYFRTDQGRLVVVRPLLPEERRDLPPLTLPKLPDQTNKPFDTSSPVDDVVSVVSKPFQL